MTGVRHIV